MRLNSNRRPPSENRLGGKPVSGILRPIQLKIGVRLTLSFITIVALMAAGYAVALWQFRELHIQEQELDRAQQRSAAVLNLHAHLFAFRDKLEDLADSHNGAQFVREADGLRKSMLDDMERAKQALIGLPPDLETDSFPLVSLGAVESALPVQIDAMSDLARAEDWSAIRLRSENQIKQLSYLTSSLVDRVAAEAVQERTRVYANIQLAERRALLSLLGAASITLLVAAVLGLSVTRSITRPLAVLDSGSKALARGEFEHQVAVAGADELADLGNVFNHTARRLRELYENLQESEARFRALIEHSSDFIIVLDREGAIRYLSPSSDYVLRLKSEEFVGQGIFELIHPDDLEGARRALNDGPPNASRTFQFRYRDPEGETRIIEAVKTNLLDNPAVAGIVVNARDITERKRAEDALQQAQAYLSEAQRLSQTGSLGWIPSSGEIIWSLETYRIFDYDPAIKPTMEMILQRVHPEDQPMVQQFLDRASRTGDDWNLDHRLLMPDGFVKHLHVVAHAAENDLRGEVGFVGAIMDVTAAKQSQEALEQAFREIKTLKDQLQSENIVLREEIDKTSMFEQIVGISAPLRNVLSRISKVAPNDSSVLITGETGTGKELVARAVHRRSRRSARAFVSVNCAAIPRDLIASELFGHEKGAFTGATQRRLGRFELAEGGTIFLDEVGELPAETQIALLRVLQEHAFERVGAGGTIRTNVRVIAATNRDLEAAIAAGTFRSDLFYRLNVFPIEMPSLRERREDIPLLVEYFIDRFARQAGKSFKTVNKKSLDLLQSYPWPGNIRELQNVIERSVIVCETESFSVDESWLSRQPPVPVQTSTGLEPLRKLPSQEKELIEAALSESGGRVYGPTGAAAKLGIPRSTLENKIRLLKINKNHFKASYPPNNQ
jgi:PAS domain S-box-containing protein